MTWVFAILIVLAMGGVAAVAAGHGTPLRAAERDLPGRRSLDALPDTAERPLSGGDLRRVRFSLAFRGYRMAEVDALLDRLAAEREQHDRQQERQHEDRGSRGGDHTP